VPGPNLGNIINLFSKEMPLIEKWLYLYGMEAFRFLLFPFALVYGILIRMRNLLFDLRILPSESFRVPVLSVGNLTAGGSGKTPMVEYLLRLTGTGPGAAILSRGYRRSTRGYRLAGDNETVSTLGDEPLQFHLKYPEVNVAVSECRRTGIRRLIHDVPGLKTVILDDAFQHRYVKPRLSILVTDYFKPFNRDYLLPVGRLREPVSGRSRADVIVVTKTPRVFSPIVRKQMIADLNPLPGQQIFFSYIDYLPFKPVYRSRCDFQNMQENVNQIILFTGIANPWPLHEHMRRQCTDLEFFQFPDHHPFTEKELLQIRDKFKYLPTRKKIIVTTEKDAARLQNKMAEDIFGTLPLFYVPIAYQFFPQDKLDFEQTIQNVLGEVETTI
jgi:tetraacyldisaccharide 4'-kinase